MENIIDIHPLDMRAMLKDGDEIEILHGEDDELIRYRSTLYRQTISVPVTSEWGKQVLEDAKNVDLCKG